MKAFTALVTGTRFIHGLWLRLCGRSTVPSLTERPSHRAQSEDAENSGRWYFKKDILDQLDQYFDIAKRLRKADKQTYGLWRRVGAIICPRHIVVPIKELPPSWRNEEGQPAFGAITLLGEITEADVLPMTFGAFRKYSRPAHEIESFDGAVYVVTAFYTMPDDRKLNWLVEFPIGVARDGQARVLKQITTRAQTIIHRDRRGTSASVIKHRAIAYSEFFDHLRQGNEEKLKHMTVDDIGRMFLSIIAHGWAGGSAALRVSAKRSGCVAAFGVDLLRTPYFFDGREPVYADAGHKKRIFHIVRTHQRTRADGTTTSVKSHFRGLRKFHWAGHDVVISMPGLHHSDLNDLTAGVIDEDRLAEVNEPTLSEEQAAKMIGRRLRR